MAEQGKGEIPAGSPHPCPGYASMSMAVALMEELLRYVPEEKRG
jgi:hypothetical protein